MSRVFRHHISYRLLAQVIMEAWIVFASVLAGLQLERLRFPGVQAGPGLSLSKAFAASLLVLAMLYISQLYDTRRIYGRRELLLRLFLALVGAYIGVAVVGYLIPVFGLGRMAYAESFAVSLVLLFGTRSLYEHGHSRTQNRHRLLLLGSGRPAQIIANAVNGFHPSYEMVGCVDGQPGQTGQHLAGVRIIGTVQDLARVIRTVRPDVIVVTLAERRQALPLQAILECKVQGIEVEDWPTFYERLMGKIHLTELRPSWLVFADGFRTNNVTLGVKRALDVVIAATGLVLMCPVLALIALLIKLDSPGPVLYRQERLGQGGKAFWLIKFRSMRQDAERETGPVWAGDGDPRVTRVGRFLRRTRLDEVPQLFNVLRGEMSMVGPRPERPAFLRELQEKIPFYLYRLAVKPGITGWAQVNYGYGSTVEDALEKLHYDFYYIKNRSIFLDLLILLQTLQVVLCGRGSR